MTRIEKASDIHIRGDAATRRKIEECVREERTRLQTTRTSAVSQSTVLRDAIDMYWKHKVHNHSFIADNDPLRKP